MSVGPALRRAGERGQVVVLVALLIPVLFGLGAIVMDIGNWFVHKRHLQTQVDAAALAPAPQFVGCYLAPDTANLAIAQRALEYAGDTIRDPAATNLQVQEPDDVRVVLNSDSYWASGDPTDGSIHDNTLDLEPPPNGDGFGDPCNEKALDVKATDDAAPLLWGLIPLTPSPKSKARVEIRQVRSFTGMLPWAVPEIDPARVVALFVNEDNGQIFDFQNLEESDDPSLPWSEWSTMPAEQQITFDGTNQNTGVIILVSKDDPSPQTTGTLAGVCGQDPPLVRCYGGATATSGISFIHGYSGGRTGSISSPQVRQVQLAAAGCPVPADYSAPYFTLAGGCSAVVQAVIDFGVDGDPRPLSAACARVSGYTWSAGGLDPDLGTWTGSVNLPDSPTNARGRQTVNLSWSSGRRPAGGSGQCHNSQPNSGTFQKVAAPYVSNAASGPVQYLKLTATHGTGSNAGTPVGDANSIETNDPSNQYYNYTVTVGLPRPLDVEEDYNEDPIVLRMASPSGSQNQAYDCDSNVNFREEIRDGCKTTYKVNYDDYDGDGDKEWRDITCADYGPGNLPPDTFFPDPIPDCVITETGDMTGQLRDGVTARFGPSAQYPNCENAPNNWPDNPAELTTFLSTYDLGNDPRYVTLIVTDDTAFTGQGNEPLPIKYFAGFYATGWDYHPQESPGCPDNDDHPIYGPTGSYVHSLDNGDVWGYFVNIVVFSGSGDPSEDLCAFGQDPGICIAVLVE